MWCLFPFLRQRSQQQVDTWRSGFPNIHLKPLQGKEDLICSSFNPRDNCDVTDGTGLRANHHSFYTKKFTIFAAAAPMLFFLLGKPMKSDREEWKKGVTVRKLVHKNTVCSIGIYLSFGFVRFSSLVRSFVEPSFFWSFDGICTKQICKSVKSFIRIQLLNIINANAQFEKAKFLSKQL